MQSFLNHLDNLFLITTEDYIIRYLEQSGDKIYDLCCETDDLNYQTPIFRFNILMLISKYYRIYMFDKIMTYLLSRKINLNLRGKYGETALITAVENSNFISSNKAVKLLLENGADVNIQDNQGRNAIMKASTMTLTFSSIDTVSLLIEYGSDINMIDKNGYTALMLAILANNRVLTTDYEVSCINTIKLLVNNGADVNVVNHLGEIALDLAKNKETIKLLCNNGAISRKDKPFISLLGSAWKECCVFIILFLIVINTF